MIGIRWFDLLGHDKPGSIVSSDVTSNIFCMLITTKLGLPHRAIHIVL